MNLALITKSLWNNITQNSPIILTGVAVTGVITTTVLAIRATPKAMLLIDDEVWHRYETSGELETKSYQEWLGLDMRSFMFQDRSNMLTRGEIIKITWKCYIPAVATGIVTIACIIGAHNEHLRRNAALASLYSVTESTLKEYQSKVIETIGKNKEQKVRDDIIADQIKEKPVGEAEVIFTGKGEVLCYDSMSGRYFKHDIEKIRKIINKLNRDLMSEMFIDLNTLYSELGLSSIRLGYDVGWNIDKGMIELSFSAQLTENEEPCLVLNYEVVPRYMS